MTRFPIVLFGTDYWGGLCDWIRNTLVAQGKIAASDVDLLHVTDSVEDVVRIVVESQDAAASDRTDAVGEGVDEW